MLLSDKILLRKGDLISLRVHNSEKTPVLSHQGFFFVDERFEISNLELIKDLDKIIRLVEFLNLEQGSAF